MTFDYSTCWKCEIFGFAGERPQHMLQQSDAAKVCYMYKALLPSIMTVSIISMDSISGLDCTRKW